MGNWRKVQIKGACGDPARLQEMIRCNEDYENWHCLSWTPHAHVFFGLNDWSGAEINAVGNLADSEYGVRDVLNTLGWLAAAIPSLLLQVDVGADHEQDACVATIFVFDGKAGLSPPAVSLIPPMNVEAKGHRWVEAERREVQRKRDNAAPADSFRPGPRVDR